MEPRMVYGRVEPDSLRAMRAMQEYVANSGLDPALQELVKIRASQINGCAYCLDMHTKDARANGETEQRIYALSAWEDAPFYTDAERAALALTEEVTLISDGGVSDEVYQDVIAHFGEKGFVQLVMAVNVINCWNRLSIATHAVAGSYQPAKK